jgi:demethylmenaquinone methyltransferase/2-methoxy-6-polyprenyl-1,4-benzoquinol methylase
MGLAVQKMFDGIAGRYDFLNHFLSAGRDRAWRKQAIAALKFANSRKVLDLCGGTGDFWKTWFDMQPSQDLERQFTGAPQRGVIADFSWPMLQEAARKYRTIAGSQGSAHGAALGAAQSPYLVRMDALKPCFKAGSFDTVICAYGMRNLDSVTDGIKEMEQILKPQGAFLTLEFFRPTSLFTFCFYRLLAPICIPMLGWIFSSRRQAYVYLVDSILKFCSVSEYADFFRKQGFGKVSIEACDFGISHIVIAVKG